MSREYNGGERPSVIKRGSTDTGVSISDYSDVVEEVEPETFESSATGETGFEEENSADHREGPQGRVREETGQSEYEKGYEAGKSESAEALRGEFDRKAAEMGSRFDSLVSEFAREVERFKQDFEKGVILLATKIAGRIVAREIRIDEEAVLTHTREAIKKIIGVDRIKIHVNPADEEYIREHRNGLGSHADSVREIAIEPDNKVERGGCVIESELGNIDARISTQLQLIEESLLNLVRQ